MISDLLLYIMIKPPIAIAREIDACRRSLQIYSNYAAARFHCTVLPLGSGRDIAPAWLDRLSEVLASVRAEPFPVALNRLSRNALVGKANGVRTLRQALKQQLAEAGLPVPDYDARPHLSIAYGSAPDRKLAVPPILWFAEDFHLIRSGDGRHEELGCWPLIARQGSFGF